MKIEHESLKELEKSIREIMEKHIDLQQYQLFFFGSRVDGTGDEHSDIDVGIDGP